MASFDPKYDLLLPLQGRIRPRRIHLSQFHPSTSTGSVLGYLGIPFAQPPIETRRWQVPQGPLPTWSKTRQSKWQSDPYQDFAAMEGMYRGRKGAKTTIPRSEDCLYLNVWVPESRDAENVAPRPVLVWIYGGAFSVGNCSRPLYDGARLAHESGCIIVSLTYRIGIMGFLGSRAMAREAAGDWPLLTLDSFQNKPAGSNLDVGAGNWGLWDLVSGLLWVQSSIEAFGGNRDNVTVFGESAGSVAIHYLLLSPLTPEAVFHKAVLESGVAATLLPRTTHAVQAAYDMIVRSLCPYHLQGDEAAQLEYLRTRVSADDMAACLRPLVGKRPRSEYTPTLADNRRLPLAREDLNGEKFAVTDQWGPVWDGAFVDEQFVARAFSSLPPKSELNNGGGGIVVGMCADEGTMFNFLIASNQSLAAHQERFHPELASDLGRLYGFDAKESAAAIKMTGREKAMRDQQAFYTCATYTGDAQFTAPILDYMAAQNGEGAGAERVDVYGYLLAHRPSSGMLEALTVVPEMTEEWAAFHTLDIPFVFGLTGAAEDVHTLVSDMAFYGVDPEEDDHRGESTQIPIANTFKRIGMTDEERDLSLYVMRTWTALARLGTEDGSKKLQLPDNQHWLPLGTKANSNTSVDSIHLLTMGGAPQAPTEAPTTAPGRAIRISQTELGQHAFSQQRPVSDASLQDRVNFWLYQPITGTAVSKGDQEKAAPRVCRYLQNYYGFLDTPPRFLPWS
ncbi:related to Acetylcholinesterase precursor [Melanopsichium pennsylvanicum]|uniref:Related to Acetylcholinesterase n=2 Tax=Melanopsichium pennsylvanicum TaxID=63383 RepID=A0AAJ4XKW6_9BASI|nr:related to Acetylcholinesterase precursor [Melanopsichium pennsylvanicum]